MRAAFYVRVSSVEQNSALQHADLEQYIRARGWTLAGVYEDKMSGAKSGRPGLLRLMADAQARKFDCILVWKLDRFGRSLVDCLNNIQALQRYGVRFISITQNLDTDESNPASRLLLHILAACSEFERSLVKERVHAGLREAKKAGKTLGRPRRIFHRSEVHELREQGVSLRDIARRLDLSLGTVTRTLERAEAA